MKYQVIVDFGDWNRIEAEYKSQARAEVKAAKVRQTYRALAQKFGSEFYPERPVSVVTK